MNKSVEVYHRKDYLACIGNDELSIRNHCNINTNSYSFLESNGIYELPQGIEEDTDEAKSYLAGSEKFKVLEMEVFKLE